MVSPKHEPCERHSGAGAFAGPIGPVHSRHSILEEVDARELTARPKLHPAFEKLDALQHDDQGNEFKTVRDEFRRPDERRVCHHRLDTGSHAGLLQKINSGSEVMTLNLMAVSPKHGGDVGIAWIARLQYAGRQRLGRKQRFDCAGRSGILV
jgi:hypothetical protein